MKKVILAAVAALLVAGSVVFANSNTPKADCCHNGASCCYPGSPCCK